MSSRSRYAHVSAGDALSDQIFRIGKSLWGITALRRPVAIVALNISSALTGGVKRVTNRNGATLAALFVLLGLVNQLLTTSLSATLVPEGVEIQPAVLAVDAPASVLALGYVLVLVATTYVQVVAIRVFVGGHSNEIPGEYYTRRIGFVLLNLILAGIAYFVLVAVGTVLVFVPGMIAYVAFLFASVYVAVEDENFAAALADSWRLTRGNWLSLFVLMLVVVFAAAGVGGIVAFLVSFALAEVGGMPYVSLLLTPLVLAASIVTLGIVADAFVQLREAGDATPEGPDS